MLKLSFITCSIFACAQLLAQAPSSGNKLQGSSRNFIERIDEKESPSHDASEFPPVEAVEEPTIANEDSIFDFVEESASFEGGQEELIKFIANNINYPDDAKEAGVEGKVYIRLVVYSNGEISQIAVLRGVNAYPSFAREARRVLKLTNGRWSPAKLKGKAVASRLTLPIVFKL
jgi:protein TonB